MQFFKNFFSSIAISIVCVLIPGQSSFADDQIYATGDVIDGGNYFSCGIQYDGYVICWGGNPFGETNIPADLGRVTAISSGGHHTCAITLSQTVRCWGFNREGETNVPVDLGKVTQISAGWYYTCAITIDQEVKCWGRGGDFTDPFPIEVGAVQKISAGYRHMCAITVQSYVKCWGDNEYGQSNVPSDLGKVLEVDVRYLNSCAITFERYVRCWGYGGTVPDDLGKVVQIAGGGFHTCAITIDFDVKCWGGDYGQASIPSDLGNVANIGEGSYNACAVGASGFLRCWGGGPINPPQGTRILTLLQPKTIKSSAPNLIGISKVGNMLSLDLGIWDSGVSFGYQWLRDGVAISGATSSSYTPTTADYQTRISVQVTGSKEGYVPASKTSVESLVGAGSLVQTPVPIVSGSATVAGLLSASPGVWDSGVSFGYQWLRDGVEIPGATLADYEPGLADLGKSITVRVTGSKDGYKSVSLENSPVTVSRLKVSGSPCGVAGNLDVALDLTTSKPVISGNSSFGQSVKGSNGIWASGTKTCVFWMSGNQAVPLVKTGSYKLQGSDVGKEVRFVVVGTKNNLSTVRVSDPVVVSKDVFIKAKSPTIRGVAKVGVKLSGSVSSWESGTSYTYQWLRDNEPIVGANTLNYIPTAADNGSNLSIRVCGSKAYYEDLCLSSRSQIVQSGVITKAGTVSISGMSTNPGALLTGVTTQWMPGVNLQSQWLLNGSPIQGATYPQLVIQPSYRGGTLTYQVTGSMDGYQSISKTSAGKKIP